MPSKETLQELFGIDLRSLALFRIAIASVLLVDLAVRAFDLRSLYAGDGAVPIKTAMDYYQGSWHWSLHFRSGSVWFQATLFALTALFGLALLVGFRTRLATIGTWLLLISLHSRVPLLVTGGDALLGMMLFWGMFLPLGARWSIDAARRDSPPPEVRVLSLASAAILLQIAYMYFFTGLAKLNPSWLNGEALQMVLADEMITRPLGQWLSGFPQLLTVLTYATLALELVGPLLLFVPWQTRRFRGFALMAFVALHVTIELSMTVLIFSWVSLAALTLFIAPAWWTRWPAKQIATVFDPLLENRARSRRADRSSKPDHPGSLSRPVAAICLFFMIYVPLFNLLAMYYREQQPPMLRSVGHLAELIRVGHLWDMFAQPLATQYRFVGQARLQDRTMVDVLRDQAIENPTAAPAQPAPCPSQRWKWLFREMAAPHHRLFRRDASRYLCRTWNQRQPSERHVFEFDLKLVPVDSSAEPADTKVITLAHVDMLADGPYLGGVRHGHWVLLHKNRAKACEGDYRHGRQHGHWSYWSPEGTKEGEGEFREGKEHGRWTYWSPDGMKEGEGEFRDGKEHGTWKHWDKDGWTTEILYDNGVIIDSQRKR